MRPGDHINLQDYESLYGKEEPKSRAWSWLTVLYYILCLILAAAITQGCDGQAAENTAKAEQEAHERKQTVMAWWYSETYQPFKASQANVTITVCQQTDSTIHWYCYGGAK